MGPRPGHQLAGVTVHHPAQVRVVMVHDFTAFGTPLSAVCRTQIPAAGMIIGGEQAVPAGAFLVLLGVPILPGDTVLADTAVDHRIIVPRDDGPAFLTMLGFHVRPPSRRSAGSSTISSDAPDGMPSRSASVRTRVPGGTGTGRRPRA
ncbi:MAG: hypothetical protein MPK62_02120 [Alphaproteobacteria bacterium]|nr:hypothetical protein [Alphaproteobacteria bacterium]